MYVLTIQGVTLGFHRLLTHRSFQTYKPVQYTLAIVGSMAVEGPVMNWVADHRKHHAHTDAEGDPHSPHGHGSGLKGTIIGLWYAHMGWLFDHSGTSEHQRYARDLYEDRGMQRIHKTFGLWVAVGDRDPGAARPRAHRHLAGRVRGRAVGRRGADLPRPPRDLVDQLRLPLLRARAASPSTITRPTSSGSRCSRWASPGTTTTTRSRARRSTACARWELDPTAWVIRGMRRVKLAWNVVEITPERQHEKLAGL